MSSFHYLSSALRQTLPKKGVYKHYKNNDLYEVIDYVLHTETQETLVYYKSLYPKKDAPSKFVRPVGLFNETLIYRDHQVKRFSFLGQLKSS